jgi:hypothetical protein
VVDVLNKPIHLGVSVGCFEVVTAK